MIAASFEGIGMTSKRTRLRLIDKLRQDGIRNEDVLRVMGDIPRHIFVDEALAHRAYENTALPIGFSQTLSQPYIVARMTELLLQQGPVAKVLELGTGSGYQTAVLSQLVGQVYSVERIRPLQEKARERLRALKLRNVFLQHSDGTMGWKEKAPFDAIIVTAAPNEIPRELVEQLADGGRMILPLGSDKQKLTEVTRRGSELDVRVIEPVHFVPVLGGVIR